MTHRSLLLLSYAVWLVTVRAVWGEWLVRPQSVVTTVGSAVSLNCSAKTDYIQWVYGTTTVSINTMLSEVGHWRNITEIVGEFNLFFRNVTRELDGTYTCDAVLLETKESVNLTVIGDPETSIATSTSQPFVEHDLVTVNCTVSGSNPPAVVTWFWSSSRTLPSRVNRTDLPAPAKFGQAVSSLSWVASPADNQVFVMCLAVNPITNVSSSSSYNITVLYRPRVTVSISKLFVLQGSPATLTCMADGNPSPVSWTWAVPSSVGAVQSSSGNAISITSAQRDNAGIYNCTGSNAVGQSSGVISVFVLYTPVVSLPDTIVFNESDWMSVTCHVDYVQQAGVSPQFSWTGPTGLINRSQTLAMIASRDLAGKYTCSVSVQLLPTYGAGKMLYANASTSVVVNYAPGTPSFSPALDSPLTVSLGSSPGINCVPNSMSPGNPHPQIGWTGPKGALSVGKTLQISNMRFSDEGNYTCSPYNVLGSGPSISIALKVIGSYLVAKPEAQYFWDSGPAIQTYSLQCSACGRPAPAIQWFHNQIPIDLNNNMFTVTTARSYSSSPTCDIVQATLLFQGPGRTSGNDLTASDFGNFSCNSMIQSSPMVFDTAITAVYVAHSPIVQATNQSVSAMLGTQTLLACIITSYPRSTINWIRQPSGENISGYATSFPIDSHTQKSEVIINAPLGTQPESYICSASNTKGYANAAISVVRASPPDAPANATATNITWQSAVVTFAPGYNGSDAQTFSLVSVGAVLANSNDSTAVLSNLYPNRVYNLFVVASNRYGKSDPSNSVSFTTPSVTLPDLLAARYDRSSGTLSLNTPVGFNLSNSYCIKLETHITPDWTIVAPCIPFVSYDNYLPVSNSNELRVSACIIYRPDVCGDPIYIQVIGGADIPDWLIYVVAGVCTVIVLLLITVLVIYCMKRRKRRDDDETSSKQKLDPPNLRPPQWMMAAEMYDGRTAQQSFVQVDGTDNANPDCPHVILSAVCENGPMRIRGNPDNRNYLPFDEEFVQNTDVLNHCDSCGANFSSMLPPESLVQPAGGHFDMRSSLHHKSGQDRFSTFSPISSNNTHSFTTHDLNGGSWTIPRKVVYEVVV